MAVNFNLGNDTGYFPFKPSYLASSLRKLIANGDLRQGSVFLDIGGGAGWPVIEAAEAGLNAYAIEINKKLVEDGKNNIKNARKNKLISPDTSCEIIEGSYFPEEYIECRKKGQTIATKYENGVFTWVVCGELIRGQFDDAKIKEVFYPVATSPDHYELLGIGLDDVDIFFSYTWGIELPSQLELFSKYGKKDAVMLSVAARSLIKHEDLMKDLGLKYEEFADYYPSCVQRPAYRYNKIQKIMKHF